MRTPNLNRPNIFLSRFALTFLSWLNTYGDHSIIFEQLRSGGRTQTHWVRSHLILSRRLDASGCAHKIWSVQTVFFRELHFHFCSYLIHMMTIKWFLDRYNQVNASTQVTLYLRSQVIEDDRFWCALAGGWCGHLIWSVQTVFFRFALPILSLFNTHDDS